MTRVGLTGAHDRMDLFSLDSLADLHKEDAVRIRCDIRNTEVMVWVLRITAFLALVNFDDLRTGQPGLFVARLLAFGLALALALAFGRNRKLDRDPDARSWLRWVIDPLAHLIRRRRRGATLATLMILYGLSNTIAAGVDADVNPMYIVFLWMTLFLRLAASELLLLHMWLVAGLTVERVLFSSTGALIEAMFMAAFMTAFVLPVGLFVTRRFRKRFEEDWGKAKARAEDQIRVRKELEYAREMQLSMLPRESPKLDWLDIASFSLPATEVGGDYYDYFKVDDERLLVVAGDVAGHGLASGLMISGIRSCLTLLADEMGDAPAVMAKLNEMVRVTTRHHMIVTLALLRIDHLAMEVSLTAAGHPPVLIYRADSGRVESLETTTLPLGTNLQRSFHERSAGLCTGDRMVLYTDGLYETLDDQDHAYGLDRLVRVLETTASEGSAQDLRDAIIKDLWSFKGNRRQDDDITLVVMRAT